MKNRIFFRKRDAVFNCNVVSYQFAREFFLDQRGNVIDVFFAFKRLFAFFRGWAGRVDHVTNAFLLAGDLDVRNSEVIQFAQFFTNNVDGDRFVKQSLNG